MVVSDGVVSAVRRRLLMDLTSKNTATATIKKVITLLIKKAVIQCHGAGGLCICERRIGAG